MHFHHKHLHLHAQCKYVDRYIFARFWMGGCNHCKQNFTRLNRLGLVYHENPFLPTSGRISWNLPQGGPLFVHCLFRFGDIYLDHSASPLPQYLTLAGPQRPWQVHNPHPFASHSFSATFGPCCQLLLGASPLLQAPDTDASKRQVVGFTSHDFGGQGIYEDLS